MKNRLIAVLYTAIMEGWIVWHDIYKIINENKRLGVEVSLKSEIIDVAGFPFKAFVGDNVNSLIDEKIHSDLSEVC